ncbi:MAG TPA: penicillin-binding transpeptidase domain-containing protein [Candidatus Acidoferrales bacterium]|nr:penicillin-binding transpeptidase domain-containing protein [Candidatus Acidoferrales bacterium]
MTALAAAAVWAVLPAAAHPLAATQNAAAATTTKATAGASHHRAPGGVARARGKTRRRRPVRRAAAHRPIGHAAERTAWEKESIGGARLRAAGYHRRSYRIRYPISGTGDVSEFDDPVVRQAALAALGRYYGSVVAVDPNNGRILSVVNQKLAFSSGFEPCSTIKPVIALAALKDGVIDAQTMLPVSRRVSMNLTEALAHSNNEFFAELGERLGFAAVSTYAHLLGLGEPAGWDLPEEQPGTFPAEPPPESRGGIGKLSSFGEDIRISPLQLAAMASTLANGGSLYYLQYPQTEEQAKYFEPKLKRAIDLAPYQDSIREGMLAAVEFGTARESYTPGGELVYAKTGTCTDETQGGHLGWFVSYVSDDAQPNHAKLVLVVLLRRYGSRVSGPHAAEIGGRIYRQLDQRKFFSAENGVPAAVAEAIR